MEVGTMIGPGVETVDDDGFNAMGKPIPLARQQAGMDHCKQMGLTDRDQITSLVGGMVNLLERDRPYEAQAFGMKHLDLTGVYRLMAVLLTGPKT